MKHLEPDYIKDFRCVASACQDTCCAGWEVELDEESARYYRQVPGVFGSRLRQQMQTEGEETYFVLTPERRCPFLNKQNLCDLYTELGEAALCDICTEHPRFYNWFGDYTEKGLGLCCEEAERLLFAHKEPVRFVLYEEGTQPEEEADEDEDEDEWIPRLLAIREEAFAILQDRSRPVGDRLKACRGFFDRLQRVLDGQSGELQGCVRSEAEVKAEAKAEAQALADTLLSFYERLECLDDRWPKLLAAAKAQLPEIVTAGFVLLREQEARAYEWEHLAVYFLYRYLMEAVYDEDVLTRMDFMLVSLSVLWILAAREALADGYTERKRDELVRMYSREIEYCPENMEAIYEALRAGEIVPFWAEQEGKQGYE